MNKNCAIIVMSNDENSDLWDYFFKCFKRNWTNCEYPIYLVTRSIDYKNEEMTVNSICLHHTDEKVGWGKRLVEAIDLADTKYVLLLLEDFFFYKEVDVAKFKDYICFMEKNHDVESISFANNPGPNIDDGCLAEFELVSKEKNYRTTTQPSIWRSSSLRSYLRDNDTPWVWEWFGNIRTLRSEGRFYCSKKKEIDAQTAAFLYKETIHSGRWIKDAVVPIDQKYKLEIDFSDRGFLEKNIRNKSLTEKLNMAKQGYEAIGFDVRLALWRNIKHKWKRVNSKN